MSADQPDLSVDLCGIRLRNPLVLASGIWGTGAALMERVARCGAGAVTAKSIGLEYRKGHRNPTVLDWGPGLINAVGLANPGVDAAVPIMRDTAMRLHAHGVAFIASIFAHSVGDFGQMAARVSEAQPDLIEVNVSCPNVSAEFGRPFALDPAAAAEVTAVVKAATSIPIFVKLSPNVTSIVEIARAVAAAGADGLTLINTVGPGMVIDVESGCPVLSNREGGLSGPAIRPIAVRCVHDVSRALPAMPIIGTGGVTNGRDAVEMIMAGATAVGLGSALYRRGAEVFCQVRDELAAFMQQHDYERLVDMKGIVHGK